MDLSGYLNLHLHRKATCQFAYHTNILATLVLRHHRFVWLQMHPQWGMLSLLSPGYDINSCLTVRARKFQGQARYYFSEMPNWTSWWSIFHWTMAVLISFIPSYWHQFPFRYQTDLFKCNDCWLGDLFESSFFQPIYLLPTTPFFFFFLFFPSSSHKF